MTIKVETTPHLDEQLFIGPLDKLKTALASLSVKSSVQEFRGLVNPAMEGIRFIVYSLERDEFEDAIEEEELEKLADSVEELIREIGSSRVSPEVRDTLLRYLLKLRHVLQNYSISGGFGAKATTNEILGDMLTSQPHMVQGDEDRKGFAKVFDVMSKFNTVFTLHRNGKALIGEDNVQKILDNLG